MAFIDTGIRGRRVRAISMFSGMEAATVAASVLPWDFVALAEPDPTACWVLHSHYGCGRPDYMPSPGDAADGHTRKEREANIRKVGAIPMHTGRGIRNWGDMTQVDWSMYRGEVDVVVGGPPCQSFSFAGDRKSLGDTRGNLSLSYMRAIHEIQPLWCLTENVPGWLSTPDNAFGHFLGGIVGADAPLDPPGGRKWGSAGMVDGPLYRAAWRILDAQGFLPQRRRRVFVVAARAGTGGDPVRVLFETQAEVERNLGNRFYSGPLFPNGEGGGRDPEEGGAPGQGAPSAAGERAVGGGGQRPQGFQIHAFGSVAMTSKGKALAANPVDRVRCLDTCGGFSAHQGGNLIVHPHVVDGEYIPDVATTVRTRDAKCSPDSDCTSTLPAVRDPRDTFPGDGTEAVFLHCNKGRPDGRSSAHVRIVTVKQIAETMTTDGYSQSPVGIPVVERDGVEIPVYEDASALIYQDSEYGARAYDSAGTLRAGRIPEHQMVLVPAIIARTVAMLVRRLTPNECLALQGFPLDYLDGVTVGNKPLSDGPRYKLTGNSWAVPVARWVLTRMDLVLREQLERDPAASAQTRSASSVP